MLQPIQQFLLLPFLLILPTILLQAQDRPRVEMRTSFGTLVVELYNETPKHRDNFLQLVKEDFYDSLLFHRIIPQFMVQGGDPDSKHAAPGKALGMSGPGYTLEAEILPQFFHKKGVLSAARQPDQVNPEKRSSGSQFYIVQGKDYSEEELAILEQRMASRYPGFIFNEEQKKAYTTIGGAPHLDGGYTVFGEVVQGLEVIDAMAAVERDGRDRPLQDVRMTINIRK